MKRLTNKQRRAAASQARRVLAMQHAKAFVSILLGTNYFSVIAIDDYSPGDVSMQSAMDAYFEGCAGFDAILLRQFGGVVADICHALSVAMADGRCETEAERLDFVGAYPQDAGQ